MPFSQIRSLHHFFRVFQLENFGRLILGKKVTTIMWHLSRLLLIYIKPWNWSNFAGALVVYYTHKFQMKEIIPDCSSFEILFRSIYYLKIANNNYVWKIWKLELRDSSLFQIDFIYVLTRFFLLFINLFNMHRGMCVHTLHFISMVICVCKLDMNIVELLKQIINNLFSTVWEVCALKLTMQSSHECECAYSGNISIELGRRLFLFGNLPNIKQVTKSIIGYEYLQFRCKWKISLIGFQSFNCSS